MNTVHVGAFARWCICRVCWFSSWFSLAAYCSDFVRELFRHDRQYLFPPNTERVIISIAKHFHIVPASHAFSRTSPSHRRNIFSATLPCVRVRNPVLALSVRSEFSLFFVYVFRVELSACVVDTPSGPVLPVHRRSSCSDSSPILGRIASVYTLLPLVD